MKGQVHFCWETRPGRIVRSTPNQSQRPPKNSFEAHVSLETTHEQEGLTGYTLNLLLSMRMTFKATPLSALMSVSPSPGHDDTDVP